MFLDHIDHLDDIHDLQTLEILDDLDHIDHLDYIDPISVVMMHTLCRICAAQIQPRKHVLDHTDCSEHAAPTPGNMICRPYRSYTTSDLSALKVTLLFS